MREIYISSLRLLPFRSAIRNHNVFKPESANREGGTPTACPNRGEQDLHGLQTARATVRRDGFPNFCLFQLQRHSP
jgi:hypothetical protein